tara:strand:+ start:1978 stop:2739 length:762 start_codon:yes stop_codon:yes gene_type:complete
MQKKKIILIIGGHDPTNGAGISADIETANYFNFHSISILTCTTIQNTAKVIKINKMPKNYIYDCYKEVIKDFKVNVIKIGLLPTINSSKEVLKIINHRNMKNIPIIIDPIIKSGSNIKLISNNNLNYLIKNVYPKANLITPNIYEYKFLKKITNNFKKRNIENILITNYKDMDNLIKLRLKKEYLKTEKIFHIKKINKKFHGTGCTFSTALACNIDKNIEKSIKLSINYMNKIMSLPSIPGKKQYFLNRSLKK